MPPKSYVRRSHPEGSRSLLPCKCEVDKCNQEFPRSDKLRDHYKKHVVLTAAGDVTPPSRLSLIPDLKEKDKLHTRYFFAHSLHPNKIKIKPIPAPSNINPWALSKAAAAVAEEKGRKPEKKHHVSQKIAFRYPNLTIQ